MRLFTRFLFAILLFYSSAIPAQFLPVPRKEKKTHTLSICAMFQNEAPFLKEWIEFHKMMGVQHFYLYNNNSEDNYREVLAPYIDAGEVDLLRWDKNAVVWTKVQIDAYKDCVKRVAKHTRWLAFLDIDEFLVPYDDETLTDFLAKQENYSQVLIMWRYFGTGSVDQIPEDALLTETLLLREEFIKGKKNNFKCIVKPADVKSPCIHACSMKHKKRTVFYNKGLEEFPPILCHHYWTRDIHFLNSVKRDRQLRLHGKDWTEEEFYELKNRYNDVFDETMLEFSDELHWRVFSS